MRRLPLLWIVPSLLGLAFLSISATAAAGQVNGEATKPAPPPLYSEAREPPVALTLTLGSSRFTGLATPIETTFDQGTATAMGALSFRWGSRSVQEASYQVSRAVQVVESTLFSAPEATSYRFMIFARVDSLDSPLAETLDSVQVLRVRQPSPAEPVDLEFRVDFPPETPNEAVLVVVDVRGALAVYSLTKHTAPATDASMPVAPTVTRSSSRRQEASDTLGEALGPVPIDAGRAATVGALVAAAIVAILLGAAVPLFSRLDRDQMLHHPRREQIHDLIRAQPGLTFRRICQEANLASGVAQHHLAQLERHKLVRRVRDGRLTRYYPAGCAVRPVVEPGTTKARILDLVRSRPDLCATEMSASLGQRVQTTSDHLRRLCAAGWLTPERRGRRVAWRLAAAPPA